MDVLSAIKFRASAIRLAEPGPGPEALETILAAGARAPDHGRLTPWRFVVIEGEGRARFGAAMRAARAARAPATPESELEKEAAKAMRAPIIVAVAAAVAPGKVPPVEQILAAGAGVENMILAAGALGFGAMWKTGEPAYDSAIKKELGLAETDAIVAFLYLGTPVGSAPPRDVDMAPLVRRY